MESIQSVPEYAEIPGKFHRYTMRSLFAKYRDGGGVRWVNARYPEMSVTEEMGEISCMVRVRSTAGIPSGGEYIGPLPSFCSSPSELKAAVLEWVSGSIDSGYLWCPPGSVKITRGERGWRVPLQGPETRGGRVMDVVEGLRLSPLTVSTVHAAMEAEAMGASNTFRDLYPFPRTTVPSTGLFGTAHNNSFVDMSPYESEKEPDLSMREFKEDHVGFICAAHTSHSYEAGKSRRVTADVEVRLLDYSTLAHVSDVLARFSSESAGEDVWSLYCLGQVCLVSYESVVQACIYHRLVSIGKDPGFGLYVDVASKTCVICVASGVLTKLCTNGVWSDSSNAHRSARTEFTLSPVIATSGRDFIRSCLSTHYGYVPYIEHNAAVRTSISSAQIMQAVCLPWCPATAAVTPCHVFQPIVTTPDYNRIMIEQESSDDIASQMPGENICMLYHNLPLNYEDSVVVSKRYVDNGGFSTISVCRYLLPSHDYVPPVGSMLCSKVCRWWKSKCQPHCLHTRAFVENCRGIVVGRGPTGRVLSRRVLKSGDVSVKITSHEQFQAGNKVSIPHGQKGVSAGVVAYEDMPICELQDGTTMIPDMVVAVSSIVSRQTPGQVYESAAGMARLKDPSIGRVVLPDQAVSLGEEARVMDGRTGEYYTTAVRNEDTGAPYLKKTMASIGFVRVYNQSQMTRERHFTSHRSMTSRTLRTPTKRSRGGAVRDGEMEIQATIAAGLVRSCEELRRRGDEVIVLVCSGCQRLRLLHSCTKETEFLEVTLPYDTVVLDCVNKIVYNCTFRYTLVPDL